MKTRFVPYIKYGLLTLYANNSETLFEMLLDSTEDLNHARMFKSRKKCKKFCEKKEGFCILEVCVTEIIEEIKFEH